MGFCYRHPQVETPYRCMKHEVYMCPECLQCRDPNIYCKYRSSCPIHFLSKKGADDMMGKKEAAVEVRTDHPQAAPLP